MEEPDLLKLKDRIDIANEIGESHYREFKSALEGPPGGKVSRDVWEVCYDIAKTLVAFANADGGELFIGIEDDNTVSGMPFSDENHSIILKISMTYVNIIINITNLKQETTNDSNHPIFFRIDNGFCRECGCFRATSCTETLRRHRARCTNSR